MSKQLSQHDQSAISERSERKGTKALSPEARTKSRAVKVTAPALTLDNARNSQERAEQTRKSNGHSHSEGIGLKAASQSGNRNAEGVHAKDLGFGDNSPELGVALSDARRAYQQSQQ
jgi:hypothetical protein